MTASTKYGLGETVEEAFAATKSRGEFGRVIERVKRMRAETQAQEAGPTDGKWNAIPATYAETRNHKVEVGMSKKTGKVWCFFKADAPKARAPKVKKEEPGTQDLQDLLPKV